MRSSEFPTPPRRHLPAAGRSASGIILALALALSVPVSGCAHYRAIPFTDQRSASTLIEQREIKGLHIALKDLSSPRTSERHFGRSLRDYGFIPVMLLLELDPDSKSAFNVRREEVRLVLPDGRRLETTDPQDVIDAVGFSHWRSFFGYLLLLPGPFVASSVNAANGELEADYREKALRSIRISQSMRTCEGVVFFEVPHDLSDGLPMEEAFVELTVYLEGTPGAGLGERLEFPVHFSS